MSKLTTSLAASVVFLIAIAVPPARADEFTAGETFSVALNGIHESYMQGEPLSATVVVTVYADGTNTPKPVKFTSWIETPFGRGVLGSRTRMLMPGQTYSFSIAFAYNTRFASPIPADGPPPLQVTFGVTARLKHEILDASATTVFLPAFVPE